jgi:hypothetical protein
MKKRKPNAKTIRRARRRLINRLVPALQLDLFIDQREAAAQALVELEAGLAATGRALSKLEQDQSGEPSSD